MTLQLALLLGYSALLVGLGLWIGRRVSGTKDFFVAGRQLGPGLIFSTMLAANIGAGSTVGATGLGYRDGIAAWWWVGSAAIGSIVLALWIGPRIRAIAARHELKTVGDFLELRYGRNVRAITSLLLWMGSLAIPAGQLIAIASILNVVAGVPKYAGCLIGGGVVIVYFTAGGLLTSAWVNMVQLAVKLGGFAIALPLALQRRRRLERGARGPGRRRRRTGTSGTSGDSGWMYLALLGPAFIVSPGLLQKIYGARDDRAVRLGVGMNALGLLALCGVPPLLGIIARARFPELPNHELALPMVLMHGVPPLVGSLGPGGGVLGGDQRRRRRAVHVDDVAVAGSVQAVPEPGGRRSAGARGDARRGGRLRRHRGGAGDRVADHHRRHRHLLRAARRVAVRADSRRPLHATRAGTPEALASIGCGVATMVAVHLTTGGRGIVGPDAGARGPAPRPRSGFSSFSSRG